MKGFVGICIAALIIWLFSAACGDETVTYYLDKNGNGREDWGEGVWYEDEDGTHFLNLQENMMPEVSR